MVSLVITYAVRNKPIVEDGYELTEWKKLIPIVWNEEVVMKKLEYENRDKFGNVDYEKIMVEYRKALDEAPTKEE